MFRINELNFENIQCAVCHTLEIPLLVSKCCRSLICEKCSVRCLNKTNNSESTGKCKKCLAEIHLFDFTEAIWLNDRISKSDVQCKMCSQFMPYTTSITHVHGPGSVKSQKNKIFLSMESLIKIRDLNEKYKFMHRNRWPTVYEEVLKPEYNLPAADYQTLSENQESSELRKKITRYIQKKFQEDPNCQLTLDQWEVKREEERLNPTPIIKKTKGKSLDDGDFNLGDRPKMQRCESCKRRKTKCGLLNEKMIPPKHCAARDSNVNNNDNNNNNVSVPDFGRCVVDMSSTNNENLHVGPTHDNIHVNTHDAIHGGSNHDHLHVGVGVVHHENGHGETTLDFEPEKRDFADPSNDANKRLHVDGLDL